MFSRSARWYDAIYEWKDYAAEARRLCAIIEAERPGAATLLDVGCGTGRHLEHLRSAYRVEGLDLDPRLLAIAGERLPGVPLHVGDMLTFHLGRRFDVVACLFASIAYTRTEENLRRAVANLAGHAAPGGVVIVEPFIAPELYRWGTVHANFVDQPDLKIARINVDGGAGPTAVFDFHYLVGTPAGVEHFTERHELGLFPRAAYEAAFQASGLSSRRDPEGLMGRGLFVGRAPG